MFIDHKSVVALEYIFYMKNADEGRSNYLTARPHEGEVKQADDEHMLGAEDYHKNIDEATRMFNSFTDKPIIYDTREVSTKCFLDENLDKHLIH